MRLSFLGAARFVTGSMYLLEAGGLNILVDCGMLQGSDGKKCPDTFAFDPASIDYVLLTHAHIDHSGRIPKLVKDGFKGTVLATSATAELSGIMLLDSASIQESEAEWINRKKQRRGEEPAEPLYTKEDAYKALSLFSETEYGKRCVLSSQVSVRFIDAGHLLGSSSVEVFVNEDGKEKKIVFSGDIGNLDQPIINDPEYIKSADVVVMESTYGTRLHEVKVTDDINERAKSLAAIVDRTFRMGGKVIIPSFAVGRTQELLYLFRIIISKHYLDYPIPVYLDSPLSIKATAVFRHCVGKDYFDDDAMELIKQGINPFEFDTLVKVRDTTESIALNTMKESAVIISSSGMCEGGRIRHHLKHNLYKKENTILFVGYQAAGTLGRSIVDGARHVTIFSEQIEVKAEITSLPGLSGHADRNGLIRWITSFSTPPEKIFVTHGDENSSTAFANMLCEEYGLKAYAPSLGESFDLSATIPSQERQAFIDENEKSLKDAREMLAENLDMLDEVINRLDGAARSADSSDTKRCIRLSNAVRRLASDLADLADKWKGDAD
ncbi:MAG: MBL fold metallo-hydrolase RNA specificity domain-containing protein [Bullifex sp.]